MPRLRRIANQGIAIAAITALLCGAGGEILLRQFYPQVLMFPRWEPSPAYGVVLPQNVTMVHRRPGLWEYRYTINADRCRGTRIPISADTPDSVVVALGDSYTMGMGVNDGEEYPAVLAKSLGKSYRVLNCGSPGWGLPQEVRRYNEFAAQYNPGVVILQFCANDPEDGQRDPVAGVEDGNIVLHDTNRRPNPLFNALSGYRIVQSSQLYALFRAWYESRRDSRLAHADSRDKAEQDYIALLETFAAQLHERKIRLIFISVNGQLEEFPGIKAHVLSLADRRWLEFQDVAQWFQGMADFASPEGHRWGVKAHAIIGKELARVVTSAP